MGVSCVQWSAVAERLANRTIDPRVMRLNPGLSVSFACVPGQNTTTNYLCILG